MKSIRFFIFYLFFASAKSDLKNCFVSHKNIKISCGNPLEIRFSISLEECLTICVNFNTQCETIQYDYSKNNCEIYSTPSPLKINSSTANAMKKRETALGNTECALASLLPTIGTTHLIPNWDCISGLRPTQVKQVEEDKNQQNDTPKINSTINARPNGMKTSINSQQSNIKIKKLVNDQFEIVSNSRASIGEDQILKGVEKISMNDTDAFRKQMEPNTLKNLAIEVLPVVPDCPVGEHSRIQVIDGVEVDQKASIEFTAQVPEQCVHSCRSSTYPDGSRLPLLCRSAQFDRMNRKCALFSDAINPNGYLEYKPNQKVIYIEKVCIPDVVLPLSCDDVFRRIPQHILLGHASEVLSVSSEQECVMECIRSKNSRSLNCHSVLHYPDFPSMNCILNIHTRHSKNQYFTPELAFKVDYVELGECVSLLNNGNKVLTSSRSVVPPNPFDKFKVENIGSKIGLTVSEWTEWTKCNDETSTRSRQRDCTGCKEIIQFLPCFSNNNFDVALQKFIKEQQSKENLETSINPVHDKIQNPISASANTDSVIKFPPKITDEEAPKKSVEFFGPPRVEALNAQQQEAQPVGGIHAMSSF